MARVLLIHNPDAGHKPPTPTEMVSLLVKAGHEVMYQSTQVSDFSSALHIESDLVAAAGGDGPVTKTLKYCAGRHTPVAILPLGTANNVATGLGHSGDLEKLIAQWNPRSFRAFHIGLVRGDWGWSRFGESFGIGGLAETIATGTDERDESEAEKRTKLQKLVIRLRKTLQKLPPKQMHIDIDGEKLDGEFLWIEALTVGRVGPGLTMTPNPEPWSPYLEVALLPDENRQDMVDYLKDGDPKGPPPGMITRRATKVDVSWKNAEAHIDGTNLARPLFETNGSRRVELTVYDRHVNVLTLTSPTHE